MKPHYLFTALGVCLLLASCSSGTEGIFASIEREQKIVSLGSLSKTATITHMAESTALDKYFATGGRALFSRKTGSVSWDKSSVKKHDEVAAVGVTGTKVWAVAGGILWYTDGVEPWREKPLASGDTAYDLVPIRKGDGFSTDELVVVADASDKKNNVYRIDSSGLLGNALDLATAAGLSSLSAPVVSAVKDGTNYYLLSESFLWQVTGTFVTATKATVTGAPASGYAGLIFLDDISGRTNGAVGYYLSTRSNSDQGGGIYVVSNSNLGTSPSFTSITTDVQSSSQAVTFRSFLYSPTNKSLWVGTGSTVSYEGSGYMELTVPGHSFSKTPSTDANNYRSSDLPTSTVGNFFIGSDGKPFLGTVAHGLWTWNTSTEMWSQQ